MNDKLPSNKHDNNNGHKARGTSRHKWLHSDMKDMAYYYVFRLYDELVQKIQGGVQ